jgi:hypothetical protein
MHKQTRKRFYAPILSWITALVIAIVAFQALGLTRATAQSNKITYQASDENFPNPERGFYIQRAPIWRNDERSPLNKDDLLRARSQGMSMVRTYYLLEPYRNKPLAQSVLDQLQTDFATARSTGVKIVLRFAYNFGIGEADAPAAQVLQHIDQLKPVIQSDADVIAFMEAGFVGAWGEWHSSTNNLIGPDGVNENTRAIANKLLATLPKERVIAVRTPQQKRQLTGDETPLTAQQAYSNSPKARIGAHNDCFLASKDDWGTYWPIDDASLAKQKDFLYQDNQFLPQGGETCNEAEDAQPYIGCENALKDLALIRWSTINSEYHEGVLQRWKNEGCYDEVERRLGYRFRLIEATVASGVAPGGSLSVAVNMANDGWARPYNTRGLELILRNKSTGAVTRIPVSQGDTRLFLPGPGETKTLNLAAQLPASVTPGNYDLLLNLPDPAPSLNTRPEYSIRLANQNVWEVQTGYNKLNASITVGGDMAAPTATPTTPPAATPTPGVFLPMVNKLTLFNAATDQPIGDLKDGATLDLKKIGTSQLSVVATTNPAKVGSVAFALDRQVIQTENFAPYSIKGDAPKQGGRNYLPWTPTTGKHTLVVTPYSQAKGQGQAGTPMQVTFTVAP